MIAPDPMLFAGDSQVPRLNLEGVSRILRGLLRARFPSTADPAYYTLQEALYAVRTRAGFTGAELAIRLGVSPQTVSTVENGETRFAAGVIERLARIAGCYALPRAAEYLSRMAAEEKHRSYRKGGRR